MEIISMEVDYLDVVESVIENKFLKLGLKFDQIMFEYAEKMSDLDCLYLTENATEDEIYIAIKEEVDKTTEKSKGVLASMISAVRTLFKKIKEAIIGTKVDKDNLPEKLEVESDPKKLESVGKETNSLINKFLSGDKSVMKTALIGISAALGTAVIAKGAIIPTINNLKEFSDEADKTLGRAQDAVDSGNLNPEEQSWLKKAIGQLRSCGSEATKIIKNVPKMGTQEYKDMAKKNREERKEKSVLRKGFKKAGEAVSSAVKSSLDNKDDEKIENAAENREINYMRLPQLHQERDKTSREIATVKKEIDALRNKNGKGSFFSKHLGKLSQMRKRRDKLDRRGDMKTDSERKEFVRLTTEIADIESKLDRTILDLSKKLKGLEKKLKLIDKNIANRNREIDKGAVSQAKAIRKQNMRNKSENT